MTTFFAMTLMEVRRIASGDLSQVVG